MSSDDEVSLARAAAVPNLDRAAAARVINRGAKLLDGVAERPAARAPIEMERKRARSDDPTNHLFEACRPTPACLPACRPTPCTRRRRQQHAAVAAARLHGPVVSTADLPDLAKRRKVDEPCWRPALPSSRVTTIPRANSTSLGSDDPGL